MSAADDLPVPFLDLKRVALLLDIDGTLLDIAPTPTSVLVPSSLVEAIANLSKRLGGAVAFVSGRPLESIDRLFHPLVLPAVGCHGGELRPTPAGKVQTADPIPAEIANWFTQLEAIAPGVSVENKGYALAVHFRCEPEAEPLILRTLMARRSAIMAANLLILRGKSVVEIKPGWYNKGTALRRLMRYQPFLDRDPVFVGDDTTDEDVFRILPELDGTGFSVGRTIEGAAHVFVSPGSVRDWLIKLAAYG